MKRFFKIVKRIMIIFVGMVLLLAITVFFYIRQPKFGKAPTGKRLEMIEKSVNYRDGKFQNQHFTPDLTKGYSMLGVMYDFFFRKFPRTRPMDVIPSEKTDLLNLASDRNVLVWFGHSSYFIQIEGKRFLIDPVFCGNASPIPGSNRSFKGSDIYTAADMPSIDYLLITHDHYDHLDYETILALKEKVGKVICGLGVGESLEHWGVDPGRIIEKDWYEHISLPNDMALHTFPARHFSGRSFSRNNTLWLSFVLQTPHLRLYLGGDSGYDTHFAEVGEQYGPIDLAILDNGQYNVAWQAIHMLPEEGIKAAQDLKAKRLFPVHSSKFMLAHHPWDEPLIRITALGKANHLPLVTPIIGQVVDLDDGSQKFREWWQGLN